jgi:periplasmic divalent cation tolerance protein
VVKRRAARKRRKGGQCRIVLVNCGKISEARRIARAAVESKLAACVNIVLAPVESVYRWKGKVEIAREYLLVMNSVAQRLPELQRLVQRLHSYDVPEFVVLPIVEGSREYLDWLMESAQALGKIDRQFSRQA